MDTHKIQLGALAPAQERPASLRPGPNGQGAAAAVSDSVAIGPLPAAPPATAPGRGEVVTAVSAPCAGPPLASLPAGTANPRTILLEEAPRPLHLEAIEPERPAAPAEAARAQAPAASAPAEKHSWVPGPEARLVETPTTVGNLTKLARSVKLNENVLMIGPTGAGKTSLVKYLAHLTRNELRRINLNDMTDVSELVGGYKPGPSGRPEWRDGIVVEALKKGQWLLFDEINLAPPEILERLNSLLDDDRFLVLSEKLAADGSGPEVVKAHPETRIFATMNPASYSGRKELSAAMLNRFQKVWVDGLKAEEMVEIIKAKSKLDAKLLLQMAVFHQKIADMAEHRQIGKKGGPYPFTLRDLLKWVKRVETFATPGLTQAQVLRKEAREVYEARFMNEDDRKAVEDFLDITFGKASQPPVGERETTREDLGGSIRIGEVTLPKGPGGSLVPGEDARLIDTPSTVQKMTRLAKSVALDEPILMVGPTAAGKTSFVRWLAQMTNNNVRRFNLSNQTDVTEFIGGYVPKMDPATGKPVAGQYEWKDGLMIEAMKRGDWVILDEINLAEPSILERLNSLLDDDRAIVLTEHEGEKVKAHPNFRVFATMNPATQQYGGRRELSLAMRNRFTEQWFPELTDPAELQTIVSAWLKKVPGGDKAAAQMVKFHCELRPKVENGDLPSLKKDGYVITLRELKRWCNYLKTFQADEPDLKTSFINGALHVYCDGVSKEEDRKAIEAMVRAYGEKL
jgi:MoxR-like ATPase